MNTYEFGLNGHPLTIETGHVARQAGGAVMVRYGDTMVLVTATMGSKDSTFPFFPLYVDYREKGYAAGKIPGSIFKREARPSEREILSARLIDHQIRPLFPKNLKREPHVLVNVVSHDQEHEADVLACLGASIALGISDIPFNGPFGCVRICEVEGATLLNPSYADRGESDFDIVVAGRGDSLTNIEGHAQEISEDRMVTALEAAHGWIAKMCEWQQQIIDEIGKTKLELQEPVIDTEFEAKIAGLVGDKIKAANRVGDKIVRGETYSEIRAEAVAAIDSEGGEEDRSDDVKDAIDKVMRSDMRQMVLDESRRIDGRGHDEIREISSEVAFLPRSHGSSLFTRGQTQAMGAVTLGTRTDERLVDVLEGKSYQNYMLDYNFPPFSTGEVKMMRGTNRREIGHGHLAQMGVEPVIPSMDGFPYTIRIVSEVLESNGSSSMASVCAASLALMDAGVPIKCPVAGINVGLIIEGDKVAVLTDLVGQEDFQGDMDLKIVGTAEGITAFQMDIKISGISFDIIKQALSQAQSGRQHVLAEMAKTIEAPRSALSQYAPRILSLKIDPSLIGSIIGPGGKIVRGIQEETGAVVEIDDDGTVNVSSVDGAAAEVALSKIKAIVHVPAIGEIFEGMVKSITSFGAFVEILPGKDGLLHISEIANERIGKVEDVLSMGEMVKVKIINVDQSGKVKLSRKALLGADGTPE